MARRKPHYTGTRMRGRTNPLATLLKRAFVVGLIVGGAWWLASATLFSASAEPDDAATDQPRSRNMGNADETQRLNNDLAAQHAQAQARQHLQEASAAYESLQTSLDSATGDARESALLETRAALDTLLQCSLPLEQRRELIAQLDALNAELTFSPMRHAQTQTYRIASGDVLSSIAARNGQGIQLIARMNNISDPGMIRLGQNLKLLDGPCHVVVSKSNFSLSLYAGTQLIRHYIISTGLNNATPVGDFVISSRVEHPVFEHPELGRLPYGHADNPLGDVWLGFQEEFRSYGIHGTAQPERLGQEASQGCIRMHNDAVNELKWFVIVGTPVEIVP